MYSCIFCGEMTGELATDFSKCEQEQYSANDTERSGRIITGQKT